MTDWYKWLWTHVGGRPWTYILRDAYHQTELVILLGFTTLGYYLGQHLPWHDYTLIISSAAVGYVLGHLFWGTRWIPGQKGSELWRKYPHLVK